jgi:hypothetical protein
MKDHLRFIASSAALGAAMFLSPAVLAQSAEEQAARALFREGLARHEAHDYAVAIQKYREAYARWKNPKILANLGTAAWEAGRYPEAAEAYDQFLDEAPANDPNRAEVEKARKDVLPKVGTLDVRVVGGGTAAFILDGKSIDAPHPERIRVEPGVHAVEGVGAGGLRGRQLANVLAGATVVVELTLGVMNNAPAAAPPAAAQEQPHKKIDLSTSTPLPWIVAGVGAAGLVTSGVFYFVLRGNAVSDLEKTCFGDVCPDSSQDTIDRANTFGLISAISLGVGIAGVGAGVALFVLDKKSDAKKDTAGVTLSLTATPASTGASARLRF